MKNFTIFLLLIFIFISCSHSRNGENPIARAGDAYLYPDDLIGIIPSGTSPKDSINLVKNYINEWIRQKMLVAKAEENIDIEKKDLDKKINDYKESILIYEYENELVREKLDTTISEKQLDDFYNSHKDNFVLHGDIFRGIFVKINNSEKKLTNLKRMFSDGSTPISQINEQCKNVASQFNLEENNWIATDIFPTAVQNILSKSKGLVEQHDSAFTYLFVIKEIMATGNTAPENFVKNEMAKIILNQRKVQMIKTMREEIFKESLKNGEFEIYNN